MTAAESSCALESAMKMVAISSYKSIWKKDFTQEAETIRAVAGRGNFFIDHVGSTAVEGLSSKPIIDILITVTDWSKVTEILNNFKQIGYHFKGDCENTPRYFLTKSQSGNSDCFNLHVCQPEDIWGRDMLAFRDELAADKSLANEYAELKGKLAESFSTDIQKYTQGKTSFIKSVLYKIEGSFSVDRILTHQSCELKKAKFLQIYMIATQLSIALIAAGSVYLVDSKYLLYAAGVGLFLMLLWANFSQRQQRHRSAGDQARRAVLLISGLNKVPPAGQKLRISDSFEAPIFGQPCAREEDHFASREKPGYKRLSELIEESAYWTRDLQRSSATIMLYIFIAAILIILMTCGIAVSSLTIEPLISMSRFIIATVVFLVSSDVLGLLLAYKNSAHTIEEIFKRVESAAARDHNESEVLLLMVDYNAAIEKSLPALPWVFEFRKKVLSQRWRTYIETKKASSVFSSNSQLPLSS